MQHPIPKIGLCWSYLDKKTGSEAVKMLEARLGRVREMEKAGRNGKATGYKIEEGSDRK